MIDRESAMARFKALLAESVRDPEATWAQSLPALQRDVQGRCVFGRGTVMDEFELRDEFLNHVAGLLRKVATDARVLLEETIKATCKEDFDVPEPPTPKDGDDDEDDDEDDEDDDEDGTPLTSFVAAAEVLSHDPRFEKCPLNERARLYCEHIRKLCDEHGAKVPRDVEALAQELEKARLEEARERAAIDAEETAKMRGWRGDDREQSRDHRDSRPPRRSRSRSRDRGRKRSRSRSR
jgi:transcription elongation regulator 1